MSYATTANRANPLAAVGALAIPGAIGALFIAGFAIKQAITPVLPNPDTTFIDVDPIEVPPEPKPESEPVETKQTTLPEPDIVSPPPISKGPITTTTTYEGPIVLDWPNGDLSGSGVGPISLPDPIPSFDPVSAAPSGNPGEWITNSDYRTSWINRGFEGVAGFSLTIDTRGRVTNCSITQSTGHSALDQATCRLLERRARFEPARDSSGNTVSGSYSSSVNWSIPE
ncbi:MAG: energy transducer TonB [Pseudomonadota bacterium]